MAVLGLAGWLGGRSFRRRRWQRLPAAVGFRKRWGQSGTEAIPQLIGETASDFVVPGEVLLQQALGPEAVAAQSAAERPALRLCLVGSELLLRLEGFPTLVALKVAFDCVLGHMAERWGTLRCVVSSLALHFRFPFKFQTHFFVIEELAWTAALFPTI